MLTALWVATLIVQAGPVKPAASLEPAEFGKRAGVFTAADGSATFETKGPGGVIFEVRAEGKKPETLTVTIVRNGRYKSEAKVALKPAKKDGPEGFILMGKVGLTLTAGDQKLVVSAGGRKLAVFAAPGKPPKPITAGPETDIGGAPSASAVAAAPVTEPAAKPNAPALPSSEEAAANVAAALASSDSALQSASLDEAPVAPASRGPAALRVAVYNFELSGVDPNIGAVVTDSMLAEVRKLSGISAIGMDEIKDMLSHEANKQFLGCEASESCLAEIAGALGVDDLVSGKLAKVDDGVVFLVRRIDQRRAKVVGVVNQRLKSENGQEFLAAIGPAVEQLFTDHPLREGLSRGVPKEMALRLDPPPLPTWSFWTVAGGAVAAAAVGGFFGLNAMRFEQSFKDNADRALEQEVPGRDLVRDQKSAEDNAMYANISFGTAGAFAIAAGVMALFTDWYGYGEAAAEAKAP